MKIAVIGGGAAGFFAAISAKQANPLAQVVILEASSRVLKKVGISGGGRCNVTHACFDPKELVRYYPRGGKALLGPFYVFQPRDTMRWFEQRDVSLKTESDGRVFPVSDSSQTIIDCFLLEVKRLGILIKRDVAIKHIDQNSTGFLISFKEGGKSVFDRVILATGSSNKGFQLAAHLGHSLVEPVPSLFTFHIHNRSLVELSGISVPSAGVFLKNRAKLKQQGALLITHWGLSGPAILKLSSFEARYLHDCDYQDTVVVQWLEEGMAAITEQLHAFRAKHLNKFVLKHSPFAVIPVRLWSYLMTRAGVGADLIWQGASKQLMAAMTQVLYADEYAVVGKSAFKEEFVTCGGVALNEVDFKTMQSKICPGLYFAGEILDIDALTGGFNFQNAWTTGYVAGAHVGN